MPTIFSVSPADKPSAALQELWDTVRPSSMLLHALVWGTALYRDMQRAVEQECKSHEVLSHRSEALGLISKEVSLVCKGKIPSEALLWSIVGTTGILLLGVSLVDYNMF